MTLTAGDGSPLPPDLAKQFEAELIDPTARKEGGEKRTMSAAASRRLVLSNLRRMQTELKMVPKGTDDGTETEGGGDDGSGEGGDRDPTVVCPGCTCQYRLQLPAGEGEAAVGSAPRKRPRTRSESITRVPPVPIPPAPAAAAATDSIATRSLLAPPAPAGPVVSGASTTALARMDRFRAGGTPSSARTGAGGGAAGGSAAAVAAEALGVRRKPFRGPISADPPPPRFGRPAMGVVR